MRIRNSVIIVVFLCSLLSACSIDIGPQKKSFEWMPIQDGFSKAVHSITDGENVQEIVLFRLESTKYSFSVASSETPKTIQEWGKHNEAFFLFNGGYFMEDFSPAGLFIQNSERVGERMFDQDKSGIVEIQNGNITILDTIEKPVSDLGVFENAIQSYPFYFRNGQKSIQKDSGLTARRTALGIDINGDVYLIFVKGSSLSLFEVMNILGDLPISFEDVINLDGGPSSSYLLQGEKKEVMLGSPIPNIILIHKK